MANTHDILEYSGYTIENLIDKILELENKTNEQEIKIDAMIDELQDKNNTISGLEDTIEEKDIEILNLQERELS